MKNLSIWNDVAFNPLWSFFDTPRTYDRFEEENVFHPVAEMEETDSHYLMSVDLPGVAKKDIHIEVKDNQLFVSGERKNERKTSRYSERSYGKFHRTVSLPQGIDADKIEAEFQDGVLNLALPKAEIAKPRQIKISEGKGTSFFGKFLGGKETDKEHKTVSSSNAA